MKKIEYKDQTYNWLILLDIETAIHQKRKVKIENKSFKVTNPYNLENTFHKVYISGKIAGVISSRIIKTYRKRAKQFSNVEIIK